MNVGSEAVFQIVNRTLPHLREGLDYDSAQAAAEAIFEVVGVSAIAISDTERILAFVGEGADHHRPGRPILTHLTLETLSSGTVTAVQGRQSIGCPFRGCPLESAIVAPLRSHRYIAGSLKFYSVSSEVFTAREVEFAAGLAQMLSLELELAEIDIQKQLTTRAELQALQAQISPHFLFNTLNTIASYCRRDGVKAEEMLVEFAELFRRNLKRHQGLVRVQEELDFVDSYLRFEQYRFGERLAIEHDHEKVALSVRVPPLILQPLVENAIAHGVTSRVGRSTVLIQSYVIDEDVVIAVQDDGVGMDPDILSQPEPPGRRGEGEGIGLRNVQRRLQGVYGHEYGLRITSPPEGGTRVEVRVPKRAPRFVFSSVGAGIASAQATKPAGDR